MYYKPLIATKRVLHRYMKLPRPQAIVLPNSCRDNLVYHICRNVGADSSKYFFNSREDTGHNNQGQRHCSLLDSLLPVPPNIGMNAQHNEQQRQVGHRFAMSGNMQQQPGFQLSSNPHSPSDLFGQNQATASAPTEASNSALLQNLTALAKLDQLTSEQQQQQSVNMQHQAEYQNIGPVSYQQSTLPPKAKV